MSQHEVHCRNFKCPNNDRGDCLSARLEFVPVGGIIDRLICVQCERDSESEKASPTEEKGEANDHPSV